MSTIADLLIKVRADTDGATKDLDNVGKKGSNSLHKVGKAAGVAALALGTGAAIGLGYAAKVGFDEFNQGQKVAAQTNAVLKSTGKIAGVSASHVSNLAGSLMKKSGVDDEAIQSGENLLLTFTGIRNEVGKGNNIFDQATSTILDMSVALGQDTKSSAIQLGKALNDPIKGVTALQRVGVSFTAAQKEQIKAMVASGNTMGAQKLILGELNKEFGGSAEAAGKTFAGQINVAKETLNNYAGAVVGAAVPALASLVTQFNGKALPAISAFIGEVQARAVPIIRSLMPTFISVGQIIVGTFLPIVKSLATIFMQAVTAIAGVLARNRPQLEQIWHNLSALIKAVAEVALPILRVAFTKVLPALLAIVLPIMAKISGVFGAAAAIIRAVVTAIEGVIGAGRALAGWVGKGLDKVASTFQSVFGAAAAAVHPVISVLKTVVSLLERVIDLASSALGALGKVGHAAGKVGGLVHHIPGFASGVRNFAGGVALVGERGPELVNLPRGSDVFSNRESRQMMGGGGTPGVTIAGDLVIREELDIDRAASRIARRLAVAG